MSKEKFLTVSIIFLLVLNVGIVTFLFFSRPSRPPEIWKMMVREVRFDDQQQHQFFGLRDMHRASMDRLDAEFARILNTYLQLLKENPNPVAEDSLAQQLASIEKQKAEITLAHFRSVKAICRTEQVNDFNRIIPELMRVLLPPKKDFPPRRK
jgi:periplasmic protein CpxP/Spy